MSVLCGTPSNKCSGAVLKQTSSSLKGRKEASKCHSSSEEAFRCYARYLMQDLGCVATGSRTFAPPDGGPVYLLDKKSKFGGKLRKGKNEKGSGSRLMPKYREGGLIV